MIGIKSIPGFKYNVGIAYVAIPSDLDRGKYIADCFKNSSISVYTEDGGFNNRVPISPEVLGFIEFPINTNELGSPVIYITDEVYKHPYVVARLLKRNELGDNKEYQFKFKRILDKAFIEISGSVQNNTINLLIDSADQAGQLNINLFSKDKNSKLSIDVQGDVEIVNSGSKKITQQKEIVVETIDENGEDKASWQQSTTENKFYNKKLIVNDGTEPMVLGNKFKEFMNDFIDELSNIKTNTAIGLQPIINAVQVNAFKAKIDNFLSKEGYLKE